MKNQTFLGIFLALIGIIGLIVGLVTGHFTDSVTQMVLYILPLALGVLMIVIDQIGQRKK